MLDGAAPAGGAVVSLSSSNPAVASVPAAATVAEGTTARGFTMTTTAVSTATSVTITATYLGVTRAATATITAASPPPPPPQTATLTVNATGRSGERVVSTPTGISVTVGSSGSASFATGTSVTLRVQSGRDAIWSGACSSGGQKAKTCTLTVSSAASVSVNVV